MKFGGIPPVRCQAHHALFKQSAERGGHLDGPSSLIRVKWVHWYPCSMRGLIGLIGYDSCAGQAAMIFKYDEPYHTHLIGVVG